MTWQCLRGPKRDLSASKAHKKDYRGIKLIINFVYLCLKSICIGGYIGACIYGNLNGDIQVAPRNVVQLARGSPRDKLTDLYL